MKIISSKHCYTPYTSWNEKPYEKKNLDIHKLKGILTIKITNNIKYKHRWFEINHA